MIVSYATVDDYALYADSSTIPADDLEKMLHKASRQIDSLTHNRIVAVGFDNLTDFQQRIVREVCCKLADFDYDNAALLASALSSYSVNGVSMSFGGMAITVISGVPISRELYVLLSQTGLCTGNLNWRNYQA